MGNTCDPPEDQSESIVRLLPRTRCVLTRGLSTHMGRPHRAVATLSSTFVYPCLPSAVPSWLPIPARGHHALAVSLAPLSSRPTPYLLPPPAATSLSATTPSPAFLARDRRASPTSSHRAVAHSSAPTLSSGGRRPRGQRVLGRRGRSRSQATPPLAARSCQGTASFFGAASGGGFCYKGGRRLLCAAAASATCPVGGCYIRWRMLLQWASAASATCPSGGCYGGHRRLLRAAASTSTRAASATCRGSSCYSGRR
jgi:hypothetical protein